jgi:hypothetical protein
LKSVDLLAAVAPLLRSFPPVAPSPVHSLAFCFCHCREREFISSRRSMAPT